LKSPHKEKKLQNRGTDTMLAMSTGPSRYKDSKGVRGKPRGKKRKRKKTETDEVNEKIAGASSTGLEREGGLVTRETVRKEKTENRVKKSTENRASSSRKSGEYAIKPKGGYKRKGGEKNINRKDGRPDT